MHDLVIREAIVVDGLGHDPISADVAIRDGRIVAIRLYSISTKGPGQVLDRFLPATAASLASAAQ
jgi:N-acyl-D-aspartate/D-glutamate deacylase